QSVAYQAPKHLALNEFVRRYELIWPMLLRVARCLLDKVALDLAAVIFLMNNGFVTGTVLPIDGGGGLV
ncbi:MAG TPA: hypothetical protein VGY66_15195, partial [Gemmataceae bacterium]|nr:hypothetical protein [Gemmataceae bacterium]